MSCGPPFNLSTASTALTSTRVFPWPHTPVFPWHCEDEAECAVTRDLAADLERESLAWTLAAEI